MAADFVVNSLADPGDGVCDETECTLREAIEEANGNEEADTITFDETLAGGTIALSSGELTIAVDTADPDLTIEGDLNDDGAPDITVDAQDSSRVFFIATGADATSQGLVITGGIENFGTLTVTGSTISGNSAANTGGGIDNRGTLTVADSTISGNSGGEGGGISNAGVATIKSTIVAGNTAEDCDGTLTSQGLNLEGGTSCGFTATGDQQNVAVADVLVTDANGVPLLADNGGPTQTIALLDVDTNPALDAIPLADCAVAIDQRGISRPQPADGNCDIGAFELVQEASVTIADVIELFDQAVADGTLTGAGPGRSAAGRLNALRNMLLAAGDLLAQGDVDGACRQLQDAADRTDGASPPDDFVQGEAAPDLLDAVTELQDELGCFA
jgi:CSLREA domain-containing protein